MNKEKTQQTGDFSSSSSEQKLEEEWQMYACGSLLEPPEDLDVQITKDDQN